MAHTLILPMSKTFAVAFDDPTGLFRLFAGHFFGYSFANILLYILKVAGPRPAFLARVLGQNGQCMQDLKHQSHSEPHICTRKSISQVCVNFVRQ